jgi:hypothetical protein
LNAIEHPSFWRQTRADERKSKDVLDVWDITDKNTGDPDLVTCRNGYRVELGLRWNRSPGVKIDQEREPATW